LASVISGIVFSFFLDLPTGATIVLINFMFFISSLAYKRFIKG
jgi:ABC-type Mn2+/Zn2+ transport system permease subunit